jgi:hypothetical protein
MLIQIKILVAKLFNILQVLYNLENLPLFWSPLLALPTKQGKDVAFRFIIEYSSFRDFGP